MATDDDHKSREDEPLEQADAFDCDARPTDCEFDPGERDGAAEKAEASLREEIFETFSPRQDVMVPHPVDGLPVPRDEGSKLALAHPFRVDTVVCLEDTSEYVEVFSDELGGDALRDGTEQLSRSRYDATGVERERRCFPPDRVQRRWGYDCVEIDGKLLAVRPKRPRCAHYKRQVMANDDQADPGAFGNQLMFRNCTMRKSVGGAFMTVSNEAVYACDYRSPPDPLTTEQYMDAPDRKRLTVVPEQVPLFNLKG